MKALKMGSKARPYKLRLPATVYSSEGADLGFHFTREEIRQASKTDGFLGVRRFMPTGHSAIKPGIPLGAHVECYTCRRVM